MSAWALLIAVMVTAGEEPGSPAPAPPVAEEDPGSWAETDAEVTEGVEHRFGGLPARLGIGLLGTATTNGLDTNAPGAPPGDVRLGLEASAAFWPMGEGAGSLVMQPALEAGIAYEGGNQVRWGAMMTLRAGFGWEDEKRGERILGWAVGLLGGASLYFGDPQRSPIPTMRVGAFLRLPAGGWWRTCTVGALLLTLLSSSGGILALPFVALAMTLNHYELALEVSYVGSAPSHRIMFRTGWAL